MNNETFLHRLDCFKMTSLIGEMSHSNHVGIQVEKWISKGKNGLNSFAIIPCCPHQIRSE